MSMGISAFRGKAERHKFIKGIGEKAFCCHIKQETFYKASVCKMKMS